MNQKNELDPRLMKKLTLLDDAPDRQPKNASIGRAAFLEEAQVTAVTLPQNRRHNGWMHAFQSKFIHQRKDKSPMFSTFATLILIAALVLGGGGVTVAAAQTSQPDQPLYGVKVLSEDVRLGLSTGPQSESQLALEFTNRRAAEIQGMLQDGNIPPEAILTRYQNQVEQAVQFALDLPNDQAIRALDQIRSRLQTQLTVFLQVQANGSPKAETALVQTRHMLQDHMQWVEQGLTDPVKLRDQLRQRIQDRQNSKTPAEQSTQASPGKGGGSLWTTGTPTPGSGYGPGKGPGDCENCTPTKTGQGSNPWATGTPTPGSGYGPGPQPTQKQNNQPTQAGPKPTQQQKNQPTQAAPQPTQSQQNQPTQAVPQSTQPQQNQPEQPGQNPTAAPGGPGGKH